MNSIEVDVTDLDQLGGLLAGLFGEGVNRLDRVNFGLQDPTAATDEARRRAIAEGARLAALYADAAGVSIGDLMSLSESGGGGYRGGKSSGGRSGNSDSYRGESRGQNYKPSKSSSKGYLGGKKPSGGYGNKSGGKKN